MGENLRVVLCSLCVVVSLGLLVWLVRLLYRVCAHVVPVSSLAESIYCNGVIKTILACLLREGLASLMTRLVLALFCAT